MGQFASKEYDGDPYVDLMRALPERELIWWVQKAIWVSWERSGAVRQRWLVPCLRLLLPLPGVDCHGQRQ
jgi:hypothetical protein